MSRQSSQNVLLLLAPCGRMLSKTTGFLTCRPVRNSISEPCNVKKLTKRPHCPHTASKTASNRHGLPHVVLNGLQNGQIAASLRLALRQDPADFVFSSSLAVVACLACSAPWLAAHADFCSSWPCSPPPSCLWVCKFFSSPLPSKLSQSPTI